MTRLAYSVQQLPLPAGADAAWVVAEHMRWLPSGAWPLVRVDTVDDRTWRFCIPGTQRVLLELVVDEASTADHQILRVTGGLLSAGDRARFTFRVAADRRTITTELADFAPRLPWPIYRCTQFPLHGLVMARFGRHLARATATPSPRPSPSQPSPTAVHPR